MVPNALLVAVLILTSGQAAEIPFRMTAIDLRLDLDYTKQSLAGTAAITLENWSDAPAAVIPVMVGRLMTIESIATDDGRSLPFTQSVSTYVGWTLRQVNTARVELPQPIVPGQSTRITVKYAGHLVGAAETGMGYVRERLDPAFTVLRSESFAFPQIATPSVAAERAVPRRDFTFTAEVTVPDTLIVATGGEVVSHTVSGKRATFRLRSTHPVPFLNLTVAPYRVFERRGIRAYVLPADSAHGPEFLRVIDRALEWLTARYGGLPVEPRFAIMEIPTGYGSQASLYGGIMIEAAALQRVENRRGVYHEMTHLWNASDAEAPSSRWNEGLATYLEYRIAADLDNIDVTATMNRYEQSLCRAATGNEALRNTPMKLYGEKALTDMSYHVGAVMFNKLEQMLGADAFDRAYRALYQRTKNSLVSLSDLENAFVDIDPRARSIFAEWIHSTRWQATLCGH